MKNRFKNINEFNLYKNKIYEDLVDSFKRKYEQNKEGFNNFVEYLKSKQFEVIKESGLFDDEFYLNSYPDVSYLDIEPLKHYMGLGASQKCNPNNIFNTGWYLKNYPSVKNSNLNPFFHYLIYGIKEGRFSSEEDYLANENVNKQFLERAINKINKLNLFDKEYYVSSYSDVLGSNISPLLHYIHFGYKEGRNPSREFNTNFYLEEYPDVKNSGMNPLVHYVLYGIHEDYFPNPNLKNKPVKKISNSIFDDEDYIEKGKEEIIKQNLFDEEYYLTKYSDVKRSDISALDHYIKSGYKEGRTPSKEFDAEYYLDLYADVREAGINPLIHYALKGRKEGRFIKPKLKVFSFNNLTKDEVNHVCENYNAKTSIIIPIYNAFEEVQRCINSVLKYTTIDYELILVNDCSTDERMKEYLESVANKHPDLVTVIHNEENMGFVKSVNIGMKSSQYDVVLLNSDTEVTERWLNKLRINAYSKENIATVTPLSNSAGVFSVPVMNTKNKIPSFLTLNGMAKLVEECSMHINMEVPTGNGFCLYIKRKVIDEIGYFDEEHFGKGYGEENDFCMRALRKGWTHIIDDSTYIYHKESASFTSDKEKLIQEHMVILNDMYPEYSKLVFKFINSNDLSLIQKNIENAISNVSEDLNNRNVLYLSHEIVGTFCGTGHSNDDLTTTIPHENSYLLASTTEQLILYKKEDGDYNQIEQWDIRWNPSKFYDDEFKTIYFNILYSLNIDIIHIEHLVKQSYDMPKLAKMLDIPVVIMFHDYYYLCPSINLLDNNFNYCGGDCDSKYSCKSSGFFNDFPNYQKYVTTWRKESEKMLENCSVILTPTNFVLDIYKKHLPVLEHKKCKVIYHGRNFDDKKCNYTTPKEFISENKPVKILVPGRILEQKGAYLVRDIKQLDTENRIEFHFLGKITNDLSDCGIYHGEYKRENFKDIISNISPSFIGLFSIWPETYCYTLTEAWDCGIPVIATDIGAFKERINNTGAGKLISYTSPKEAYQSIIELINNETEYNEIMEKTNNLELKSLKEMAMDHLAVYDEIKPLKRYLIKTKYDLKNILSKPKFEDINMDTFDDFLINSVSYPLISYPLNDNEEMVLNMMKSLQNDLIRNVPEKNKPLVSVIMPSYNRRGLIENAIESVLNQTYENFELIIVDDGSFDGSFDYLRGRYSDPRVKVFSNITNKGASHARNHGLEESSGDIITYLDSDNTWEPQYIESTVGAFNTIDDAKAIYSGQYLYRMFSEKESFGIRYGAMNKALLYHSNYIDLNCFAHKREVYGTTGGFDENLKRFIDWDYLLKIDNNYKIYSVPFIQSNYYVANADNRITDTIDNDTTKEQIKNKIMEYDGVMYDKSSDKLANSKVNNESKDVSIIIPNCESKEDVKICLTNLKSHNVKIEKIILISHVDMDLDDCYDIVECDTVELIKYDGTISFTNNVLKAFNLIDSSSDVLLLNCNAILNEYTIKILQNYSQNLNKAGLIVPQQILSANESDLIEEFMYYFSEDYDCDISLSVLNSKIDNVPLYSSGEVYELKHTTFFCMYLRNEVFSKLKNSKLADEDNMYNFGKILSTYIKSVLNYKIYNVPESKARFNIGGLNYDIC